MYLPTEISWVWDSALGWVVYDYPAWIEYDDPCWEPAPNDFLPGPSAPEPF